MLIFFLPRTSYIALISVRPRCIPSVCSTMSDKAHVLSSATSIYVTMYVLNKRMHFCWKSQHGKG